MVYYLFGDGHEDFVEELKALPEAEKIRFYPCGSHGNIDTLDLSDASHLLVTGTIEQIKRIMLIARKNSISIGIVPLPEQSKITKILDLPTKKEEAFKQALLRPSHKVDMFFCNDILVIDALRIGNTSVLKEFEFGYIKDSLFTRLKHFWDSWRQKEPLKHYRFRVKTANSDEKQFSAVGLIGLDYDNGSWVANALKARLGSGDGQHVLAILAPTSLLQHYISRPLQVLFGNKEKQKIPRSMGYIKSAQTHIDCSETLEVLIDDSISVQTPISLRTEKDALSLSVGENFWDRQSTIKSDRNSIKLDNLPKDEEQIEYLSHGLPLFRHASKDQYSSLFGALREEGMLSSTFMILLVLATMIATFGLFINSGSVIIGAMLLAPLMQPIVSLSMGVLRQDINMQKRAAQTIAIGVFATLVTAAIISLFIPIQNLTSEMAGRLTPTILDLFVAIVSGIAAAYVKNNDKIASSLAGVAIAVALVPPIAVAGIGIGWGEWSMFSSAFLLFITNLVGIVLAAAITFMILGYSPIKIAQKGLIIWFTIALLTSVPLYKTFNQMIQNANIQNILTNTYFNIHDKKLELTHIEVLNHKEIPEIRCEIISNGVLTNGDKLYLRDVISKTLGKKVEIIATFRYRL